MDLTICAPGQAPPGRVVLLAGEPGVGKSRLIAELEQCLAGKQHASLRYFCSPHHRESALYPVIVRWEQEAGFAHGDTVSFFGAAEPKNGGPARRRFRRPWLWSECRDAPPPAASPPSDASRGTARR